ncbi:MAG TPA: hypothetical protein VE344_04350 [Methylomirabilota bacterium]|nr:hypothetical protein [Methylomirabilota bacterium]
MKQLYGLTEWLCSLAKQFCGLVERFYRMENCFSQAVRTFSGADYSPLLNAELRR